MAYSVNELMEKTVQELKDICQAMGVRGVSKKSKSYIAEKIVTAQNNGVTASTSSTSFVPELNATLVGDSKITVCCGAAVEKLVGLSGKTINEAKELLQNRFSIPVDNGVVVNGFPVANDRHILKDGDVLEFIRKSGSKG